MSESVSKESSSKETSQSTNSSKKEEPQQNKNMNESEPKNVTEKQDKITEVSVPKLKNRDFQQNGVLMSKRILTIELDDVEQYIKDRKSLNKLKNYKKNGAFYYLPQ